MSYWKQDRTIGTSYVQDLEKVVQDIISLVIDKQNEMQKMGSGMHKMYMEVQVPNAKSKIVVNRALTIPELKAWKMEFLKMCRVTPIKSAENYPEVFVNFLNSAILR